MKEIMFRYVQYVTHVIIMRGHVGTSYYYIFFKGQNILPSSALSLTILCDLL